MLKVERLEERDVPATWAGGDGVWNDPTKWVGGVVPAPGEIDTFPANTGTVTINTPADIGKLVNNAGAGATFKIAADTVIRGGNGAGATFNLESVLTFSGVWVGASETYTKTGLSGSITINSSVWSLGDNGTVTLNSVPLTNLANIAIGTATLQMNGSASILNYGTILSLPGHTATVAGGSVINYGTLQAMTELNPLNGNVHVSTLTFTCPVGQFGIISEGAGSHVYLNGGGLGGDTGGGGLGDVGGGPPGTP